MNVFSLLFSKILRSGLISFLQITVQIFKLKNSNIGRTKNGYEKNFKKVEAQ